MGEETIPSNPRRGKQTTEIWPDSFYSETEIIHHLKGARLEHSNGPVWLEIFILVFLYIYV